MKKNKDQQYECDKEETENYWMNQIKNLDYQTSAYEQPTGVDDALLFLNFVKKVNKNKDPGNLEHEDVKKIRSCAMDVKRKCTIISEKIKEVSIGGINPEPLYSMNDTLTENPDRSTDEYVYAKDVNKQRSMENIINTETCHSLLYNKNETRSLNNSTPKIFAKRLKDPQNELKMPICIHKIKNIDYTTYKSRDTSQDTSCLCANDGNVKSDKNKYVEECPTDSDSSSELQSRKFTVRRDAIVRNFDFTPHPLDIQYNNYKHYYNTSYLKNISSVKYETLFRRRIGPSEGSENSVKAKRSNSYEAVSDNTTDWQSR